MNLPKQITQWLNKSSNRYREEGREEKKNLADETESQRKMLAPSKASCFEFEPHRKETRPECLKGEIKERSSVCLAQ